MKKQNTKLSKKVTAIIDKYYDRAWEQVMRKGLEPSTANLLGEIAKIWYKTEVKKTLDS